MMGRFVLAQISDTHVRADTREPVEAMKRALEGARAYKADAILLTGDLVNDEKPEEYTVFAEALRDPPAPLYLMPGNHDDRAYIRDTFPEHRYLPKSGHLSYVIDEYPVRIVCIDQIVPGQTHGDFTPELVGWLDGVLAANTEKPTLVALHHPPFATHDILFDKIGLHQSDRFAGVIAKHPHVTRIICGHHHRVAIGQVAHAPVIIAPSTSWAYGLALNDGQPIAPRTSEQPGWMLHVWTQDSGFSSVFMGV